MSNNISSYVSLKSNGYAYGLFKNTCLDARLYKITKNITLIDMFHGSCMLYMSYFITLNPDWTPMKLYRTENVDKIIHVFAIKKIHDVTYFADARGITDDCALFFKEYLCLKDIITIEKIYDLPELDFEDMLIFKKAYDMIYKNEPLHI